MKRRTRGGGRKTNEKIDGRFEREALLHAQAAFGKIDDSVEVPRKDSKYSGIISNDLSKTVSISRGKGNHGFRTELQYVKKA